MLISNISILVTFITRKRYQVTCPVAFLVCVLDFSDPFHGALVGTAMVSLAGMAIPANGNVTTVAENQVFDIINFVAIYYKGVRAGMPFFEKNTSEQRFSEGK